MTDENNSEIRDIVWNEACDKLFKGELNSENVVMWFESELLNKARQQGREEIIEKFERISKNTTFDSYRSLINRLKKEANKSE